MTPQEVYARQQQRLIHECRTLRAKAEEMKELSSGYNRYVDLDGETKEHRKRMLYIIGLFGLARVTETTNVDDAACLEKMLEGYPSPQELHEKLPIWRAVREYLRVAGKSRVCDIESYLIWLGRNNVTRPAIESALKRHDDWFHVSNKRHERYVELRKGAK